MTVTKAIIEIIYEQIAVWSFIISSFPYNILKETYKMLYNPVFCCDFNSASIQEKENIKTGMHLLLRKRFEILFWDFLVHWGVMGYSCIDEIKVKQT